MFLNFNYHVSQTLHLSLESFYGNGLTPEEAKSVIEGIRNRDFRCSQSAINRNWNVNTRNPEHDARLIEQELKAFLYAKKGIFVESEYS
jgi:hypothetical protein